MSAILPTSQQLINAAWAYGFIAATACGLMLAWVITSCLLDRYKSRFFDPPVPQPKVVDLKTWSLSAAALGKAVRER